VAALFLDPSALVKRYIAEAGSQWVRRQTALRSGNEIFLSALAGPEVTASLARAVRGRRVTARLLRPLLGAFKSHLANRYQVIELDGAIMSESMRLAETHGLRGADAVHLAAALAVDRRRRADSAPSRTFVSADREQQAAARLEGLTVDDPNQHR
jgi:uncharacterized protein